MTLKDLLKNQEYLKVTEDKHQKEDGLKTENYLGLFVGGVLTPPPFEICPKFFCIFMPLQIRIVDTLLVNPNLAPP